MAQEPEIDVFLSHNSKDKPIVEEIGCRLKNCDLRVWFDTWELRPGSPWQDGLEEGIKSSGAVAVFISDAGLGPWQEPEMRAFINRSRREKLAVIPVLLPGAPRETQLPMFLGAFTWVDLRKGLDEDGMARLIWGISGIRPDAPARISEGTRQPPLLHNLPFDSLGVLFKGRDAYLDMLSQVLAADPATAVTQKQTLSGLGGIGKTRLAVEYAWQSGLKYSATLFVNAEGPEALNRGLAELAGSEILNLKLEGETEEQTVVTAVLRWLRENPGWLLILDNVDSRIATQTVRKLLPRFSGGHVILTSRLSQWPPEIRKCSLDKLETEAALKYLLERTDDDRRKRKDEERFAQDLAKHLDGLPLALEQAASYIAVHGLSFEEYLEVWKIQREAVLSWYNENTMNYPCSVAVTWQHTFRRLEDGTRELLHFLAHFATEPISREALKNEYFSEVGDVRIAVAELAQYSLVFIRRGNIVMHRMVQEVVRGRIPEGLRRLWIQKTVELVVKYAPGDPQDVRTWPVWNLLRPHVERVVELAELEEVEMHAITHANPLDLLLCAKMPTTTLMTLLGLLLTAKSLYTQAEPLYRHALEVDEKLFGEEAPQVARDLNNLAQLLQETNRLSEAEPLMRRALEIDEKSFGKEHPKVTTLLSNLAQLLQDTNRLSEAEPLMRRVLEIDERSFGEEHPRVAMALNNLAVLLKITNRLSEAEPLMRRALEIDEKSFGEEHPAVAADLNNLAQLLQDINRLSEAEPLMRRALEIDVESFGEEHPAVARDLNNLARLLQTMNRLSEAEPLMRRTLEIDVKTFGEEHPAVARDLNNLAGLLQYTNRLSEAEPLMRRALEINVESFGEEHPAVATNLGNLADLLQDTNRLSEAEPLMSRALEIDVKSFGEDHPAVAKDLNSLAQLLQTMNRLSEAEPLMRRALQICEKSLVEGHPWTEIARRNLEALMNPLEQRSQ